MLPFSFLATDGKDGVDRSRNPGLEVGWCLGCRIMPDLTLLRR